MHHTFPRTYKRLLSTCSTCLTPKHAISRPPPPQRLTRATVPAYHVPTAPAPCKARRIFTPHGIPSARMPTPIVYFRPLVLPLRMCIATSACHNVMYSEHFSRRIDAGGHKQLYWCCACGCVHYILLGSVQRRRGIAAENDNAVRRCLQLARRATHVTAYCCECNK